MNRSIIRAVRALVIVVGCLALAAGDPAPCHAQGIGSKGGGGKGGKGKKPPNRTGALDFNDFKKNVDAPSGSDFGEIRKYSLVNNEKDPDLLGMLQIKPFDPKNTKTLSLRVLREKDYSFLVCGHTFTQEEMSEMLTRGLQCTAKWKLEGNASDKDAKKKSARPKRKELVGLEFRSVDVEGTIYKIDGEIVELRVRPKSGQEWPDVEYKQRNQRGPAKKAVKPRLRKLRLKVFEDSSKVLDASDASIDISDLRAGQAIEASGALSSGVGVLGTLKLTDKDEETEAEDGEASKPEEGGKRGDSESGNRTRRG